MQVIELPGVPGVIIAFCSSIDRCRGEAVTRKMGGGWLGGCTGPEGFFRLSWCSDPVATEFRLVILAKDVMCGGDIDFVHCPFS